MSALTGNTKDKVNFMEEHMRGMQRQLEQSETNRRALERELEHSEAMLKQKGFEIEQLSK